MSAVQILNGAMVVVLLINQKDYEPIIIEGLKSGVISGLENRRLDATPVVVVCKPFSAHLRGTGSMKGIVGL
jgi:hypothetical protein